MKKNKIYDNRQAFLRTFFSDEPHYEVKEVNGFYLVKQHDSIKDVWNVAIYTQEAFRLHQDWKRSMG